MSRPLAPLSLCARKNPLEVAFLVLFWRTKKNEAFVLQYLPSDKKIFRVLTGSCRGGIMESRRGEKTFKSILRRQGERTTATRFSQYPPLSLRYEAQQRQATEKYFCQTLQSTILALDTLEWLLYNGLKWRKDTFGWENIPSNFVKFLLFISDICAVITK